jgi:predicted TIM-barrel enzyme
LNRGKILEAWQRKRPLTGGAAGGDFIVVSNLDQLAVKGAAALLPLGDANALSLQSAKERIPKAGTTPVIAGVCATDPLRLMDKFLLELKRAGVAGVQNAPSVGLIDGGFRTSLEEAKLGYAKEVELMRLATKLDLLTLALVFTAADARAMAEAGSMRW